MYRFARSGSATIRDIYYSVPVPVIYEYYKNVKNYLYRIYVNAPGKCSDPCITHLRLPREGTNTIYITRIGVGTFIPFINV